MVDREFSRKCGKCRQRTMEIATIPYSIQIDHDGRKYTVNMLVRKLILRCQELKLPAPFDTVRLHFELTAYLATLVTNHLYTGRFKRSV